MIWLWLLVFGSPAWADPKDDARRHFAAGLKAAQDGNFEIALQRFLAAQDAYPHPATLYNIAKAYTDLDDLANALTYYRLYRDAAPERAADVDPILAVLEARLGQSDPEGRATAASAATTSSLSGPTEEEIARLESLARELGALTDAFRDRAEEEAVAVAPQPDPAAPTEPALQTEFFSAAYERVVVTASRVGQDPLDSPSTVTVLTADDIRLSGATNVPDLLRAVVGVDVMALSAGHTDLSIRGFNRKLNNKVLVLIDGRSTYLDFIGTTFWASFPIEVEEIERVEVIRGPGSAVYGANAVTGVINIITRTPGEGPQVVTFDGGTPALGRGSAVVTGRSGLTTWRMSGGFEQHGRWSREVDLQAFPAPAVQPFFEDDSLALQMLRLNARVDRTLGELGAISLSGGLSEGRSEFYSIGALSNFGLDMAHHYVRGDLFLKDLHLRGFWNSNDGETGPWLTYVGESRTLDAAFDNDVVDLELEAPLHFETGPVSHQIAAGGGWRYKRVRFGYLDGGFDQPFVENHFQAFVNEQATWTRFSGVASLRVDAHPLIPIDQTLSPRAALLYRLFDRTSLRATAGSAYRAPTAIESYMNFALPTPADGVFIEDFGNLNLRPERIATVELGVHDESTASHQADAVVYLNRVTDLIFLDDVTVAFEPFDPDNAGISAGSTGWVNLDPVYTGIGLEAELELYPVDGVDLFANFDLMRIVEATELETVRDGSASTLKLNAGAAYRTPYRTDLSLSVSWLSRQDWRTRTFDPDTLALEVMTTSVDPRLLATARVAARPLVDEDLELAVTAWNFTELWGDGFREHPEGQPVGGRLFGSVGYRF